jgi:hypothetical protein
LNEHDERLNIDYDVMERMKNYNFSQSYSECMLSEYDTQEAAAIRALEENVFGDVADSESYNLSKNMSERSQDIHFDLASNG